MSLSSTTESPTTDTAVRTTRLPALAGGTAALLLLGDALVGVFASGNISDHSAGAGRVSEALVGAAFLAAAGALVALLPAGPVRRALCLPGIVATALTGVAMLTVTVTGREWPESLVTILVLVNLVGLIVQGIVGARAGVWPWWAGLAVALFLPAMFFVPHPFNAVVMALIWLAVALAAWRR